jgi:hypothetical protein
MPFSSCCAFWGAGVELLPRCSTLPATVSLPAAALRVAGVGSSSLLMFLYLFSAAFVE